MVVYMYIFLFTVHDYIMFISVQTWKKTHLKLEQFQLLRHGNSLQVKIKSTTTLYLLEDICPIMQSINSNNSEMQQIWNILIMTRHFYQQRSSDEHLLGSFQTGNTFNKFEKLVHKIMFSLKIYYALIPIVNIS